MTKLSDFYDDEQFGFCPDDDCYEDLEIDDSGDKIELSTVKKWQYSSDYWSEFNVRQDFWDAVNVFVTLSIKNNKVHAEFDARLLYPEGKYSRDYEGFNDELADDIRDFLSKETEEAY